MAFRTKKISQMDPKGSNLASTDLLEISELVSGSYVTKSITGAEIIASVPPTSVEWGDIGGVLSTQIDLQNALNGKQDDITLTTTGTSGASTFVANTLNVPTYSLSGLGGVPTTRTLTINGTTQDLSADRTFTISTGITIGTTAITSGTVGRVLFEGTGNVVQESANLFWDNTNGRLGIGTSSPTQKLDVVGIIKGTTSSVGTMLDISGVTNSALNVINDSSGRTFLTVKGNPSATSIGGAFITVEGFQEAWCNVIARQASAGNQYWRFGNLGSSNYFAIQKLNDTATAITLTALTAFSSTGNIGINTTTDAGFKLDVNGTARVSGNTTLNNYFFDSTGFLTYTSGANPLYIQTGAGGGSIILRAGGSTSLTVASASTQVGNHTSFSNGALDIAVNANYIFRHSTNGNSFNFRDGVRNFLTTTNSGTIIQNTSFNGTAINASALLEVQSTTKGFLPPRMTTTEKNAIATPAAGLVVYDSTLNKLCVRTASAWETITSL